MKILSVEPSGVMLRPTDPFPDDLPQVAFVGRSNVGKSSLVNKLLGRKNLAPISSKPGKTKKIHFFKVNDIFYLVDLPGYGFAKKTVGMKDLWKETIEGYFDRSKGIRGVVSLVDIRHEIPDSDINMLDFIAQRELPVLVVLTKADKLGRGKQQQMLSALLRRLRGTVDSEQVIVTSAEKGTGIEELSESIESLVE